MLVLVIVPTPDEASGGRGLFSSSPT